MIRHIIFFIALVSIYYACTISLSPKSAQGSIGDNIDFKITVKHIHLPCLLAINATEFKYDKVTLLKETGWDTINAVTFEKTITVRLDHEGKGEIDVSRTCPIRTSEVKVNIDITGTKLGTDLTAVLGETKKWLVAVSKGDTASLGHLKSLKEWLIGNSETYLPKTNTEQTHKKFAKFLARLDKVLALADSLKQAALDASKSAILKEN
jgi:hypothetical protein